MTHNREPTGPVGEKPSHMTRTPYLAVRGDFSGIRDNLPLDPRDAEGWLYLKRRNDPTWTLGLANARGDLSPTHEVERCDIVTPRPLRTNDCHLWQLTRTSRLTPQTTTSLFYALCPHSCTPGKTSRSVTHPQIAPSQAHLTWSFF